MLKEQRIFFYTFIGLETLVLTLWLLGRERLERIGGVIAGALLTGAWVAATIGLFLVPLSMVGLLLLLIGTLGFTPWLTAYVYLHHGRVALRAATVRGRFGYVATSFVFGAALALGVPLGVHLGVERAWENAISDVAAGDTSANARVRFFYRFVDTGGVDCPLDAAVDAERDPLRKERLAELRQHW